jgi:hypothetical protein
VYWKGVNVNSTQIDITGDIPSTAPIELICDIYYLTMKVVDSRSIVIENAQVIVTASSTNEVFDSQITDDTGIIISRLPIGSYDISVRWFETQIYLETNKNVDQDYNYSLDCWVYYIELTAVDSRDVPLEEAQISVEMTDTDKILGNELTDETGILEFRLPIGTYDIEVFWEGVSVKKIEGYNAVADDSVLLDCNVFYIDMTAVDSRNITLEDAQISIVLINTGKIYGSVITNETGKVEFRLPIGIYEIEVIWEGISVKLISNYSLDKDASLLLDCNVFYFTVNIIDYERWPLENAQVYLTFSSDNTVYDSQITPLDGQIESRMPIGNYDIEVIWKGVQVYYEASHMIDSDELYTINAKVFYVRIRAIDNEKEPIKDVSVTIKALNYNIVENRYSNKSGRAEFRLPIEMYNISARYQTTYLLMDIDLKESMSIDLSNSSQELTIKFDDYPPPITDTPLFWIVLTIVILIIIIFLLWFLVIRKLKKKEKEEKPEDEEESKKERAEPVPIVKTKEKPKVVPKVRPNKMMMPIKSKEEPLKNGDMPEPESESDEPEKKEKPTLDNLEEDLKTNGDSEKDNDIEE